MTDTAAKLRECPFCGAMPKYYGSGTHSTVICTKCPAAVQVGNPEGAIHLWNTRAPSPLEQMLREPGDTDEKTARVRETIKLFKAVSEKDNIWIDTLGKEIWPSQIMEIIEEYERLQIATNRYWKLLNEPGEDVMRAIATKLCAHKEYPDITAQSRDVAKTMLLVAGVIDELRNKAGGS